MATHAAGSLTVYMNRRPFKPAGPIRHQVWRSVAKTERPGL